MPTAIEYRQQIAEELRLVPDEKLPDLAKIVHVLTDESPEARLARAGQQAQNNDVVPLDNILDKLYD